MKGYPSSQKWSVIITLLHDELFLDAVLSMSMISDVAKGALGAQSLRPGILKVNRYDARLSPAIRRRIIRTGFILDSPPLAPSLKCVDQVAVQRKRVANND